MDCILRHPPSPLRSGEAIGHGIPGRPPNPVRNDVGFSLRSLELIIRVSARNKSRHQVPPLLRKQRRDPRVFATASVGERTMPTHSMYVHMPKARPTSSTPQSICQCRQFRPMRPSPRASHEHPSCKTLPLGCSVVWLLGCSVGSAPSVRRQHLAAILAALFEAGSGRLGIPRMEGSIYHTQTIQVAYFDDMKTTQYHHQFGNQWFQITKTMNQTKLRFCIRLGSTHAIKILWPSGFTPAVWSLFRATGKFGR